MLYMGIDTGSVSTDFAVIDENFRVIDRLYLRTRGKPIAVVQEGLRILGSRYRSADITGVGTTGSGRKIISRLIGSDSEKNEITAHAAAALSLSKRVKTIIEIGGQDSKLILIDSGIITDFAMNTVCAAGTGSFIDRQAERLGIPIEEFGDKALLAGRSVRIAGRCAVFAESDMIHKQQLGFEENELIRGLCDALVRNYLSNVGKGRNIKEEVFFQGGVAANKGIRAAFQDALGINITVPENYDIMGAIGSAILAEEAVSSTGKTRFRGFNVSSIKLTSGSFECSGCQNRCEIIKMDENGVTVGCIGDRCGKWSGSRAV